MNTIPLTTYYYCDYKLELCSRKSIQCKHDFMTLWGNSNISRTFICLYFILLCVSVDLIITYLRASTIKPYKIKMYSTGTQNTRTHTRIEFHIIVSWTNLSVFFHLMLVCSLSFYVLLLIHMACNIYNFCICAEKGNLFEEKRNTSGRDRILTIKTGKNKQRTSKQYKLFSVKFCGQ